MLIRLWWKEGRSLAPIVAILLVAAVGLQWFLLSYGGSEIRNGSTVAIALGWAAIYACVAGSACFAGERENRTMGFLDALPVGRSMLWLGKVSFVLVSTLVMTLVLRGVGFAGWTYAYNQAVADQVKIDQLFAVLIVEATLWGVFWSSVSKNAITAGLLTVVATGFSSAFRRWFAHTSFLPADFEVFGGTSSLTWVLTLVLVTGMSWLIVNREIAPSFRPRRVARDQVRVQSVVPRVKSWALLPVFGPYPAFWSLVWQTRREGRAIGWQTLSLVFLCPALLWVLSRDASGPIALIPIGTFLAALVFGTSVFGIANAAGTRQFLDNQAVGPRTVWAAKVGTWGAGLLCFVGGLLVLFVVFVVDWNQPTNQTGRFWEALLVFSAGLANVFTVGLVCGMICNRRITAALLALLCSFLLMYPQFNLIEAELISPWGLVAVPLSLSLVSFGWAGPWLANRGGWRRWALLAGLLATPLTIIVAAYISGRAWGVPDVGPQYRLTTLPSQTSPLTDSYRDEVARVEGGLTNDDRERVRTGWAYATLAVIEFWQTNRARIDAIRTLAGRPGALQNDRRGQPSSLLNPTGSNWSNETANRVQRLAEILEVDASERQARGDLAGAWDNILAEYRLAIQCARGADSLSSAAAASDLAAQSKQQVITWARDPRLTRDQLQLARTALDDLVWPDPNEVIRAQSRWLEHDLDQPTEAWVDFWTRSGTAAGQDQALERIYAAWIVVPSWERERTRRLLRIVTAMATGDPNKSGQSAIQGGSLFDGETYRKTPMADRVLKTLGWGDGGATRELAHHRMLDLILRIREWQMTHDGTAPRSLEELLTDPSQRLPEDPYARNGQTFTYIPVYRLGKDIVLSDRHGADSTMPDSMLSEYRISSVGPDGIQATFFPESPRGLTSVVARPLDDLIYFWPARIKPASSTP